MRRVQGRALCEVICEKRWWFRKGQKLFWWFGVFLLMCNPSNYAIFEGVLLLKLLGRTYLEDR